MKTAIIMLVCSILLALSPQGNAHDDRKQVECEKTKQKIKKLQSRMRRGYSRAQGEKWQDQLRELRALRGQFCR